MSTKPEPCTTAAKTKRHYSAWLTQDKPPVMRPGRGGRTLCGNHAMDEERANWERGKYGGRPLVVVKLPECKTCVRALAKAGETA